MRLAGIESSGCPEIDLKPRIHELEDFSSEKLKVQHSQSTTEGKEALRRVDKRWIINLDPIFQSSLAFLSLTQQILALLV